MALFLLTLLITFSNAQNIPCGGYTFTQGPCWDGYFDATNGEAQFNNCDNRCDGGIWYQGDSCSCACFPVSICDDDSGDDYYYYYRSPVDAETTSSSPKNNAWTAIALTYRIMIIVGSLIGCFFCSVCLCCCYEECRSESDSTPGMCVMVWYVCAMNGLLYIYTEDIPGAKSLPQNTTQGGIVEYDDDSSSDNGSGNEGKHQNIELNQTNKFDPLPTYNQVEASAPPLSDVPVYDSGYNHYSSHSPDPYTYDDGSTNHANQGLQHVYTSY